MINQNEAIAQQIDEPVTRGKKNVVETAEQTPMIENAKAIVSNI
jgi:hypothetical protein